MGTVPPGSALRPRVCRGTAAVNLGQMRWGPRGRSRETGSPQREEWAPSAKELAGTVPRNGPCDGGCLHNTLLRCPTACQRDWYDGAGGVDFGGAVSEVVCARR